MMADPEKPSSMGEEDMMGFIRTQFESVLKPYAENMCELHMTVVDLSKNMTALQEKSGADAAARNAIRIDALVEGQDKLMQFAQSTRQFLEGYVVEDSEKLDQEAKINQEQAMTIQSLEKTLAQMKKDIAAKSMPHLEETVTLMRGELEEVRKNGEDLRTKLVANQDMEQKNCAQLKSELQSVADNLKTIEKAQADIITTLDSHKGLFDTALMQIEQNKESAQSLQEKFIALNDETTNKLKSLNERFEENQSQLKQYLKEFEQARDTITVTSQSMLGFKDDLGLVRKETQAKLDSLDTELKSMVCAFVPVNLNERLIMQAQRMKDFEEDIKEKGRKLGHLFTLASKCEGEVADLQSTTGILPGRVYKLEQDAKLTKAGVQRVEEVLGLEPIDPKEGLKKSACSGFLSEDMVVRKGWQAWMEAVRDAKQKKIAGSIPQIQEMVQKHHDLIEKQKSSLLGTTDRVQSLEVDNKKLLEELQKMRKGLDLNEGHWKGMTRGLQAANKTIHSQLNALPPLSGLATARPVSSFN